MPRISTYTTDNIINPTDRVIGSDGGSSDATKNFLVSGLSSFFAGGNSSAVDWVFNCPNLATAPAAGKIEFTLGGLGNGAEDYIDVDQIFISKTDSFGFNLDGFLSTVIEVGDKLVIREIGGTSSEGGVWEVTGVTDSGTYLSLTVTSLVATGGTKEADCAVSLLKASGPAEVDLGYTSYVGAITGSGANNPNVTELSNNTGFTWSWVRQATGIYYATPTVTPNIWDPAKMVVFVSPREVNSFVDRGAAWLVDTTQGQYRVYLYNSVGGSLFDSVNIAFEIRIYD